MINALKRLLGVEPKADFKELIAKGAQLIDVRTPGEYIGGHIKGSVNIPLQNLGAHMNRIDKGKPVITCCASGIRSATAKSMLKANGYTEVHNGGGWLSLQSKL